MKRYLIRGTYTKGAHKGETFLLTKGGYVATSSLHSADSYYATERAAKMVATKMNKQSEFYEQQHSKYIDPCRYTVETVEV